MSTPQRTAEQAARRHRRKGFLLLTAGALIVLAGILIAWVVGSARLRSPPGDLIFAI